MNIEYKDIKDFPDKLVIAIQNFKTVYSSWDGNKLVGMICAMDDGIMNVYVHFQQDFLMLVLGYVILAIRGNIFLFMYCSEYIFSAVSTIKVT